MKEVTIEQFAPDVRALLEAALQERVVITREGRPVAIVIGIENKDEEDLELQTSPEFWRMIKERRQRPTRPLKELEAELFADDNSG